MSHNGDRNRQRQRQLQRGLKQLHTGEYWEAHEHWEQLWQSLPRPSEARRATKALIQFAAICYKPEQAAAGRSEADMQRGTSRLLTTCRQHLDNSFQLPAPPPQWNRHRLDDALRGARQIHADWVDHTALDDVRRRIADLARDFDPIDSSDP